MSPCEVVRIPGTDAVAIVCHRGKRWARCATCGDPAPFLCDQKMAGGKTCDSPMCAAHRTNVGPETDLCPKHADLHARRSTQLSLGDGGSDGR